MPRAKRFLEPPKEWTKDAACVDNEQWFFPPDSESPEPRQLKIQRVAKAQEICKDCPVRAECHAYAEAKQIDFGVWAGIDRERDLRRGPRTA